MAQAISRIVLAGEVVNFYTAEGYARISAWLSAGAGPCFVGVKSSIPSAGMAGAIRLIAVDHMDFVIGPGDSLYVGNAGALASTVSVIASPLPWPASDDAGLIQSAEMVNYDGVPTLAAQPTPTRIYSASQYVEVSISIRISTPGLGFWGFTSQLADPYFQAAGLRATQFVMAPGDQLYCAATAAAVTSDFQAVISPCPWWQSELVRGRIY